jgi:hypothetical protein
LAIIIIFLYTDNNGNETTEATSETKHEPNITTEVASEEEDESTNETTDETTDGTTDETTDGTTDETTETSGTDTNDAKDMDYLTATKINTSVWTCLAIESVYDEFIIQHNNKLICLNDTFTDEQYGNFKHYFDIEMEENGYTVNYTDNGAEFFSFICDYDSNEIHIYIGTSDNPTKWEIYPDVDAEYKDN